MDENGIDDELEQRREEERWAREHWAVEKQRLEAAEARRAGSPEEARRPSDGGRRLPAGLAAFVGIAWGLLACLFLEAVHGALAPAHAEKIAEALPGWPAWAAVLCLVVPPIACVWRPSCARGILLGAGLGLVVAMAGMLGLLLAGRGLGRWEDAYWLGFVVASGGIGGLGTLADLRS